MTPDHDILGTSNPDRIPLSFAKSLAESERQAMFLVSGPLPMNGGYPKEGHREVMQLATLTSEGGVGRKVAIYRVLDKKDLHRVMDDLEDHGGYRCALVKPDGSIDPGYYI